MTTKTCRDCREAKPLDDFNRHPKMRDGRASYCKDCQRIRTRASAQTSETRCPESRARWAAIAAENAREAGA